MSSGSESRRTRVVGWGPFRLPGERKRRERAAREADELMRMAHATETTGETQVTGYAVQIRWSDGVWTYVMKPGSTTEREMFDSRTDAEGLASVWTNPGHEDAVRVIPVREWVR